MIGARRRTTPLRWLAAALLAVSSFAQTTTAPAKDKAPDPFGRETPRKSFLGFLHAAQTRRFELASQYFQLSEQERKATGTRLARQLAFVVDNAYRGDLLRVSNSPEGSALEAGTVDRIGPIEFPDNKYQLQMVRVTDPAYGPIWLVANADVRRIPEMYEQVDVPRFAEGLPDVLVRVRFASLALWQWLGALALIPVAAALSWALIWLLSQIIRSLMRRWELGGTPVPGKPGRLLVFLVTVIVHAMVFTRLGIPVLYRYYYVRLAVLAGCAVFLLLVSRFARWGADRALERAAQQGMRVADSAIILGRRLLNVLLVVILILTVLSAFGVEMKAFLAGLGIGGIAIALAAQKTLENLIGGISVMGDEVLHVGDTCRIGDVTGTVEDVSLRSTRIRTVNGSMLSIPNGSLAAASVENLTRRKKTLFTARVGFPYGTTSAALQSVLASLRGVLAAHPRVEPESARVRFIELGDSGLTVEIFCYVNAVEAPDFLAVKEELLLHIMDTAEKSGLTFVYPTQAVHIESLPLQPGRSNPTAG